VLSKLSRAGINDSIALKAWSAVLDTKPDQEEYCRLVGSLGLTPYEDHPAINEILAKLTASVSSNLVADLCQASDPDTFARNASFTESMYAMLPDAPVVNLTELTKIELPSDQAPVAARWGLEAAKRVRTQLGISTRDPAGGSAFLEEVGIQPDIPAVAAKDAD